MDAALRVEGSLLACARRPGIARAAYPRTVEFARALVAVVALFVGVPLVILAWCSWGQTAGSSPPSSSPSRRSGTSSGSGALGRTSGSRRPAGLSTLSARRAARRGRGRATPVREAAERPVAPKPAELTVDGGEVDAGRRAGPRRPGRRRGRSGPRRGRARRAARRRPSGLGRGDERCVACAGAHHRPQPPRATHEERRLPRVDRRDGPGGVASAHRAQQRGVQISQPARPLEATARDHGDVRRQVRDAQVRAGPAGAGGLDGLARASCQPPPLDASRRVCDGT